MPMVMLLAERLASSAERLRYVSQQMENNDLEKIEVKRYKSFRDGMPMVTKFIESADEALYETLEEMGNYHASEGSGNSGKKKKKKKKF